ncbi:MAG: hypothetical protein ACOY82_17040 [Pseudomonadota bacterium]
MNLRIAAVCLALLPVFASAQNPSPPQRPAPAATSRPSLISRPSLEPVQQAFLATGMSSVRPVLVITYDANGVPTHLELDPPSGSTALDTAIVEWGRQVRLTPGKAGTGRLPFDLANDEIGDTVAAAPEIKSLPADRIALRPPLQPLSQALGAAGASSARYEFLLFFDAQGRVIDASIAAGARNDAVDRAAIEWARQVRLKPGSAGAGRLSVDVLAAGGGQAP